MKRLFIYFSIVTATLLAPACSVSQDLGYVREDFRELDENQLREIINSRRYIIKLERLETFGGFVDLRPRSNYLIVDGRNAVINAVYFGRQYYMRPVSGINMRGITSVYEVTNRSSKGMYNVRMKVENGSTVFNVYMSIGRNGYANVSVNSFRLNNVYYRGYIVPLETRVKLSKPVPETIGI